MRATQFEFKYRFWIIAAIYLAGFVFFRRDVSAIAALYHLVRPSQPVPRIFTREVMVAGALFVFLAAALRTWASAYLQSEIVHDTTQHAETLVADGPFRFTRNPLYLANLPMALGIGLLASRSGCLFMLVANWLLVYRLIGREESSLRETQGERYLAYCRKVPRFWPSLVPRLPASGDRPRWAQAFFGESFIWTFALAELVLAITLKPSFGMAIFVAGFFLHLLTNRQLRQRQSRSTAKASWEFSENALAQQATKATAPTITM